nr:pentatricopeptide repeat-containing protein At5g48910 [Tanacetum cinerariifolium]
MPQPNVFSWNTIIRAYCDHNNGSAALECFHMFCKMVEECVRPNKYTFPSVLKACAKMGRVDKGKEVHCFVVKFGLENDEFVLSNLVRMYVMCDQVNDANLLFKGKKAALGNVVVWNVMVDGYNGFFMEALELFREMQMEGNVTPNYVSLISVLPAVSGLGALEIGKWVHFFAVKNGIKIDPMLGSALIDMYSKCGSIEEALQLFESLSQKNVITWNSIITGLAIHGRANDALDHFTKMQESGISPNDVTYISVLTACSHAGLVDKGYWPYSTLQSPLTCNGRVKEVWDDHYTPTLSHQQ